MSLVSVPVPVDQGAESRKEQSLSPLTRFGAETSSLLQQVALSRYYFMREDGQSGFSIPQVEQILRYEKEFQEIRLLPLMGEDLGMAVFFLNKQGNLDLFVVSSNSENQLQVNPLVVGFKPKESVRKIDSKTIKEVLFAVGTKPEEMIVRQSLALNIWLNQFFEQGNPVPERVVSLSDISAEEIGSLNVSSVDSVDLSSAWSLAELLLHQQGWSPKEVELFFKRRIDFKNDLIDLYSRIIQEEVEGATPFTDPSRMFVSPRDQKRWIQETIKWLQAGSSVPKAIFMGALSNYLENIDSNQIGEKSQRLIDNALSIFIDHFSFYFKDKTGRLIQTEQISEQLKEWMQELNYPNLKEIERKDLLQSQKRIRSQVRHILFNKTPALFLKEDEEGELLEPILKEEVLDLKGKWIEMPMGPYSDKNQILGRRIPEKIIDFKIAQIFLREFIRQEGAEEKIQAALVELIPVPASYRKTDAHWVHFKEFWEKLEEGSLEGKELYRAQEMVRWTASFLQSMRAGQGLTFSKGTLLRAYETAMKNPNQPVVLVLDNIDATSAKVRNGIFNHYLEKGEMYIVGYVNPFDGTSRITLPKNLQLIFTASTKVPIKDQALLNRLQKYVLPQIQIEDRLKLALSQVQHYGGGTQLMWIAPKLIEIFEMFRDKYVDPEILAFHPYIITQLFERLEGMAQETGQKWDESLFSRELHILLLEQISDPVKKEAFKKYLIEGNFEVPVNSEKEDYWFDSSGELFVMGVSVGLSKALKEKIQRVKEADPEKKKWEQEKVLFHWKRAADGRRAGVVLQSQSIRMLASLIRQIKYNNRVLQVVGPTGVGKTFVGEALAIWRDQPSYSEPTHKRSEQELWTGFYEITAGGEFVYNDQTPFLEMIRSGGADLKSELNAKGDFNRTAYMSWYLNQIAKEKKELVLPFVRENESEEVSKEIIHPNYWMLIDINPEGVYGHRYQLNPELAALSGQIYLEGRYTDEDYKKMLAMALEDSSLQVSQKAIAIDVLSEVHQRLAEALLKKEFRESDTTVLTLRELLNRSLNQLLGKQNSFGSDFSLFQNSLSLVVNDNYLSFWNDKEDYQKAKIMVEEVFKKYSLIPVGMNRHSEKGVRLQVIDWLEESLENPYLNSIPPVHLRFAIESAGASMGSQIAKTKNWAYEKALISGFTEEYDLKGAFIPIQKEFTLQEAEALIASYRRVDPLFVNRVILEVVQDLGKEDPLVIAERIYSVERAQRWNAQLQWAGGILVRKILEAQSQSDQVFLMELEGFHRLDPEVAIMLNEFFLSGILYLPGREAMRIPKNLIFFLSSPLEIELEISPAEQSRHWRVTLYEYSEKEKKELILEAIKSTDHDLNPSTINLLAEKILVDWRKLNRQLEDLDREEYIRGISYWVSYAETLAYLLRENEGDVSTALEIGSALFLEATFGGGLGKERDSIPFEWESEEEVLKMSFLNDFPLFDSILNYAISRSNSDGIIDFNDVIAYIRILKSRNSLFKDKTENLLVNQSPFYKQYPHKKLEIQTLRPGDLIKTKLGYYQLFLGWDKEGRPLLLSPKEDEYEVGLILKFPEEGMVLSRIRLEEHGAQLKEKFNEKERELSQVRYQNIFSKLRFIFKKSQLTDGKQYLDYFDTLISAKNIEEFRDSVEYSVEEKSLSEVVQDKKAGIFIFNESIGLYLPEKKRLILLGDKEKTSLLDLNRNELFRRNGEKEDFRFVPFDQFQALGVEESEKTILTEEGKKKLSEMIHCVNSALKGKDSQWWFQIEGNFKIAKEILGIEDIRESEFYSWLKENEEEVQKTFQSYALKYGLLLSELKRGEELLFYELEGTLDKESYQRLEESSKTIHDYQFLTKTPSNEIKTDVYRVISEKEVFEAASLVPDPLFLSGKWLKRYYELADIIKLNSQLAQVVEINGSNVTIQYIDGIRKKLTLDEIESSRVLSIASLNLYLKFQLWKQKVEKGFKKDLSLLEWQQIFSLMRDLLVSDGEPLYSFINLESPFWHKFLTEKLFPLQSEPLLEFPAIKKTALLSYLNKALLSLKEKVDMLVRQEQIKSFMTGGVSFSQFFEEYKEWPESAQEEFQPELKKLKNRADSDFYIKTTWTTLLEKEVSTGFKKLDWEVHPYNKNIIILEALYDLEGVEMFKIMILNLESKSLKTLSKSQNTQESRSKIIPLRNGGYVLKFVNASGFWNVYFYSAKAKELISGGVISTSEPSIALFQDECVCAYEYQDEYRVELFSFYEKDVDRELLYSGEERVVILPLKNKLRINKVVNGMMGEEILIERGVVENLLDQVERPDLDISFVGNKVIVKDKKEVLVDKRKKIIEKIKKRHEYDILFTIIEAKLVEHPFNDKGYFIELLTDSGVFKKKEVYFVNQKGEFKSLFSFIVSSEEDKYHLTPLKNGGILVQRPGVPMPREDRFVMEWFDPDGEKLESLESSVGMELYVQDLGVVLIQYMNPVSKKWQFDLFNAENGEKLEDNLYPDGEYLQVYSLNKNRVMVVYKMGEEKNADLIELSLTGVDIQKDFFVSEDETFSIIPLAKGGFVKKLGKSAAVLYDAELKEVLSSAGSHEVFESKKSQPLYIYPLSNGNFVIQFYRDTKWFVRTIRPDGEHIGATYQPATGARFKVIPLTVGGYILVGENFVEKEKTQYWLISEENGLKDNSVIIEAESNTSLDFIVTKTGFIAQHKKEDEIVREEVFDLIEKKAQDPVLVGFEKEKLFIEFVTEEELIQVDRVQLQKEFEEEILSTQLILHPHNSELAFVLVEYNQTLAKNVVVSKLSLVKVDLRSGLSDEERLIVQGKGLKKWGLEIEFLSNGGYLIVERRHNKVVINVYDGMGNKEGEIVQKEINYGILPLADGGFIVSSQLKGGDWNISVYDSKGGKLYEYEADDGKFSLIPLKNKGFVIVVEISPVEYQVLAIEGGSVQNIISIDSEEPLKVIPLYNGEFVIQYKKGWGERLSQYHSDGTRKVEADLVAGTIIDLKTFKDGGFVFVEEKTISLSKMQFAKYVSSAGEIDPDRLVQEEGVVALIETERGYQVTTTSDLDKKVQVYEFDLGLERSPPSDGNKIEVSSSGKTLNVELLLPKTPLQSLLSADLKTYFSKEFIEINEIELIEHPFESNLLYAKVFYDQNEEKVGSRQALFQIDLSRKYLSNGVKLLIAENSLSGEEYYSTNIKISILSNGQAIVQIFDAPILKLVLFDLKGEVLTAREFEEMEYSVYSLGKTDHLTQVSKEAWSYKLYLNSFLGEGKAPLLESPKKMELFSLSNGNKVIQYYSDESKMWIVQTYALGGRPIGLPYQSKKQMAIHALKDQGYVLIYSLEGKSIAQLFSNEGLALYTHPESPAVIDVYPLSSGGYVISRYDTDPDRPGSIKLIWLLEIYNSSGEKIKTILKGKNSFRVDVLSKGGFVVGMESVKGEIDLQYIDDEGVSFEGTIQRFSGNNYSIEETELGFEIEIYDSLGVQTEKKSIDLLWSKSEVPLDFSGRFRTSFSGAEFKIWEKFSKEVPALSLLIGEFNFEDGEIIAANLMEHPHNTEIAFVEVYYVVPSESMQMEFQWALFQIDLTPERKYLEKGIALLMESKSNEKKIEMIPLYTGDYLLKYPLLKELEAGVEVSIEELVRYSAKGEVVQKEPYSSVKVKATPLVNGGYVLSGKNEEGYHWNLISPDGTVLFEENEKGLSSSKPISHYPLSTGNFVVKIFNDEIEEWEVHNYSVLADSEEDKTIYTTHSYPWIPSSKEELFVYPLKKEGFLLNYKMDQKWVVVRVDSKARPLMANIEASETPSVLVLENGGYVLSYKEGTGTNGPYIKYYDVNGDLQQKYSFKMSDFFSLTALIEAHPQGYAFRSYKEGRYIETKVIQIEGFEASIEKKRPLKERVRIDASEKKIRVERVFLESEEWGVFVLEEDLGEEWTIQKTELIAHPNNENIKILKVLAKNSTVELYFVYAINIDPNLEESSLRIQKLLSEVGPVDFIPLANGEFLLKHAESFGDGVDIIRYTKGAEAVLEEDQVSSLTKYTSSKSVEVFPLSQGGVLLLEGENLFLFDETGLYLEPEKISGEHISVIPLKNGSYFVKFFQEGKWKLKQFTWRGISIGPEYLSEDEPEIIHWETGGYAMLYSEPRVRLGDEVQSSWMVALYNEDSSPISDEFKQVFSFQKPKILPLSKGGFISVFPYKNLVKIQVYDSLLKPFGEGIIFKGDFNVQYIPNVGYLIESMKEFVYIDETGYYDPEVTFQLGNQKDLNIDIKDDSFLVEMSEGDEFLSSKKIPFRGVPSIEEKPSLNVEAKGSKFKIEFFGVPVSEEKEFLDLKENQKELVLNRPFSSLGLVPLQFSSLQSEWSQFERTEVEYLDTNEMEGNKEAYTESFGRIRYVQKESGLVLNIEGFEVEVYDKDRADSLRDSYLIPTERHVRALARHIEAMRQGRMVFNIGPPGSGKTAVGLDLAARLGLPAHVKPQHGMVDEKELFGEWIQDEMGNYILTSEYDYIDWTSGEKVSAFSNEELDALDWTALKERGVKRQFKSTFLDFFFNGGVYIFDEGAVGLRGKKLLELLTSLARGDKQIFLNKSPAQGGVSLPQHSLFHIIITSNEGREPIAPDLMAELETYFMNNDFTDRELEKILYSIYRNAPNISDKERFSLIQRQIRVHRSILALLEYSDEGERLAQVYQFGLRELIFAAKDIVEYLSRYPQDQELAFVDKIYSAYYKLLQTPQERSAILKAIQRHFRPVEEAGNQLLRRIEIVSRSIKNPVYQGAVLTDLAIAKYKRGRTREQFESLIQDILSIQDPVSRVEALIQLLEKVVKEGYKRDVEAIKRLALLNVAKITYSLEKGRLLNKMGELLGKENFELDTSFFVEEIKALAKEIPLVKAPSDEENKRLSAGIDSSRFHNLLSDLEKSLYKYLQIGGDYQLIKKDLFELIENINRAEFPLKIVYDFSRMLLLFSRYHNKDELFLKLVFTEFDVDYSDPLEVDKWAVFYNPKILNELVELNDSDKEIDLEIVDSFEREDLFYYLYIFPENRTQWVEWVDLDKVLKRDQEFILRIFLMTGDVENFKKMLAKFSEGIEPRLYQELMEDLAWVPVNKMKLFLLALIPFDSEKKYLKERLKIRGVLEQARSQLILGTSKLSSYEENDVPISDEVMEVKVGPYTVEEVYLEALDQVLRDVLLDSSFSKKFSERMVVRKKLYSERKPEFFNFFNEKIKEFIPKENFLEESILKTILPSLSLIKNNIENDFLKPKNVDFPFSSEYFSQFSMLKSLLEKQPKPQSESQPLSESDKMKEALLIKKEAVLSESDPAKYLTSLEEFLIQLETYLIYLRFLEKNVEEEIRPIIDFSLASDFSQIESFNEKYSETERVLWLRSVLMVLDYLKNESSEGDVEAVERYADALYLDFGLGAKRPLKVSHDERYVYISDVKLLRGQEVSVDRAATVPFIRSEESAIRGIAQGFASKAATISLLENGARIDELMTFLADEMGYRRIAMAGTRFKSVESLFGGIEIYESVDLETRKEVAWSPGLITRYMVEDPKSLAKESVILDIRNLHQISRDVRSTLFQLLQDGYWDVSLGEGKKRRLYLPKNVKLHFTLPAGVEGDLESALFSRVEKVFVGGLRFDPDIEYGLIERSASLTELERVASAVYGLKALEAKKIRQVLSVLHVLDGGFYLNPDRDKSQWKDDFHYDFHAGDGLEMAAWVKQALDYEQAKRGVLLDSEERVQVAMMELYRYVMMKLREEDHVEVESLFSEVFNFKPPKLPVLRIDQETGLVLEVMGVGVLPNPERAKRPEEVDLNYQLTLVPSMAWRLSGILRAMSPRKDRFDRLQPGQSVLAIGNSSMGKTTAGGFLTQILGLEDYFVFSVDGQTEESDLTWEYVANPKAGQRTEEGLRVHGRFAKKIQPFLEKFTQDNQVIMIDEINLKPEMLSFFVLLAKGAKYFYLDMPGGETQLFKRGENTSIWLSMNEGDDALFSGRGDLDPFLKAEQVTVRFPSRYLSEEEVVIDQVMGGLGYKVEVEKISLSPAARQRLETVARVGHWPPVSSEADPDFIRHLMLVLEQGGLKAMSSLLKDGLASEKELGLSEEKIKAILTEIKLKSLVPEPLIPIVRLLLDQYLKWERVWLVRKEHADKMKRVERKIKLYTANSEFPVTQVVVGLESFFRPLLDREPAEGLVSLSYEDVGKRSFEKLLGIARHEIGHVLFTRMKLMRELLNSKALTPDEKLFLERVIKRAPGDQSFWQFFIAEREDAWINSIMSDSENPLDRLLWEDNWYEYYFKTRYSLGLDSGPASETDQTNKKKSIGLDEDDKVLVRSSDLIATLEKLDKDRVVESYLLQALSQPHSVFSNELFLYSQTGSYSPMFEEMKKSLEPLHKEIVEKVQKSQFDYDLYSTGVNDLGESDKKIFPDRTHFDSDDFPNTQKYKEAIENETQRAVRYTLTQFLKSPTLISNFMTLFEKRKKEDTPQRGENELPPEIQALLDALDAAAQSTETAPSEEESVDKEGGTKGESEEIKEGEAVETGSEEKTSSESAGAGGGDAPDEKKPAKGIAEATKDFKSSPKDGDLDDAIESILKEQERTFDNTSSAKPSSTPSEKKAESSEEPSESASEAKVREAMKNYVEAVESKISTNKSYSKKVKEFISNVSRSARIYSQQIRRVLVAQAKKEYEIYSRGGGRFSLQRFLEWKQKFMIKTIVETSIETIDVEILIDLSGSLRSAREHLANLAVLMAAELGDLGDVGINFQIRGLDHTGVPVMFKPFQRSSRRIKKIKSEELLALFDEMFSEIGSHNAEDFTTALIQSREIFKERKSKHKLVFLVSDGWDTVGGVGIDLHGRRQNLNPSFKTTLQTLEKEKVSVIGIGVGSSDPIEMFDRFIRVGTRSDLIGEFVLKVIRDKVTGYRNKPLPKGDLELMYQLLSKRRVDPGALSYRARTELLTLLSLHQKGQVDMSDIDELTRLTLEDMDREELFRELSQMSPLEEGLMPRSIPSSIKTSL